MTRSALLLLAVVLLHGRTADAATFNVAAGDVPALIAAITAANDNGVADTIELAGGFYDLTAADNTTVADGANGLPVISSAIVINGNGATIRRTGVPDFRIFQIVGGGALTLNAVTVSGGSAAGDSAAGGGILLTGAANALTLTDSTVTGNSAGLFGGGIAIRGTTETVTLTRSTVSNNTAIAGGGIELQSDHVTLTLTQCRVTGNRAEADGQTVDGGGLSVSGGPHAITLTDCVVDGNAAISGSTGSAQGGGISSSAEVNWLIAGTTISNNRAISVPGIATGGGIVDNGAAEWTLTNCTISGNSATATIAFLGGGGICSDSSAAFTLRNVTVTDNRGRLGGGIDVAAGTVTLSNTIVAGNGGNASSPDIAGPVTSHGHNLFGTTTGATVTLAAGDITNPDADLGPLTDNGGFTQTHAPHAASPAVDAANPALPGSGGDACPVTDQRGIVRPQPLGGRCDIGAFEVRADEESPVVSYFLPRNINLKLKGAGKDSLIAAGFYDDGGQSPDYTQPVTIEVGGFSRTFTPLRKGKSFVAPKIPALKFFIIPNLRGSSRGRFKMQIRKTTLAGLVDPDAPVGFHFRATGLPDAQGRVTLTAGRYTFGKKRGALILPLFFPQRGTAKIGAANADTLSFVGGFATNGSTPGALSGVVRFGFGPAYSRAIAGSLFKKSGDKFKYTEKQGKSTVLSITFDYLRESVTVTAKKVELGDLGAATTDVVFDAGAGAGTIRNTVRLGTKGATRLY